MVKPHQVERINPSQIPRVPCFTRPDGHPARVYRTKRAVLGDVGGVGGGGSGGGYPTNYDGGYGGPNPTGWGASGGGSFGGCSGGDTSSVCYQPGDGFSGGDMYAHRNGRKYFYTSMSPSCITTEEGSGHNAQAEEFRKFPRVTPHFHGSATITFSSKYMRVNAPVVINDIQLGSVQINNTTGQNFGIISINTATPTLSMQYIIRAY